jgi:hypothetical protein
MRARATRWVVLALMGLVGVGAVLRQGGAVREPVSARAAQPPKPRDRTTVESPVPMELVTADSSQSSDERPNESPADVEEPAFELVGLVTDERGAPIDDAAVAVRHPSSVDPFGEGVSSDGGSFRVPLFEAETYEVQVSHHRFATAFATVEVPGPPLHVKLPVGGRLSGVVLLRDKGHAGVTVTVSRFDRLEARVATTDSMGRFEVTGLLPGPHRVEARNADGEGEASFIEPRPTRSPLVVSLSPVVRVFGRAVDGAGSPLAGVQVSGGRDLTTSGADGRFTTVVAALETTELKGLLSGFLGREPLVVKPGDDVNDLRLVLTALGRVRGRVVDEHRRPVARFFLNGSETASEDGRFEIPTPLKWPTVLTISAPGAFPVTRSVKSSAWENSDLGEVVLGGAKALHLLVVAGAESDPLEGVQVFADTANLPVGTTGPDGRLTLRGVPGRPVRLTFEHGGYPRTAVEAPSEGELRVVLEEGPELTVRVVDADGRPETPKVVVASTVDPGEVVVLETDDRGIAEHRPQRPSSYVVMARTFAPARRAMETVVMGPGRSEVVLVLKPAHLVVDVRVETRPGWTTKWVDLVAPGLALLPDGDVRGPAAFWGARVADKTEAGTFRVANVVEGPWQVVASVSNGIRRAWFVAPVRLLGEPQQRLVVSQPADDHLQDERHP